MNDEFEFSILILFHREIKLKWIKSNFKSKYIDKNYFGYSDNFDYFHSIDPN
jgi:hypothetical protein